MSVIIKDRGIIKMYIKGADNIIKSRLASEQTFDLNIELQNFSVIGLRTLLIASRIITEEEYQEFRDKIHALPV